MFWHNDDIKLTGCILAVTLMRQTTPVQKPRRHTRLIASVGTPSLRVGVVAGHSFSAYARKVRVRKVWPSPPPLSSYSVRKYIMTSRWHVHVRIFMSNCMLIPQCSFGLCVLNRWTLIEGGRGRDRNKNDSYGALMLYCQLMLYYTEGSIESACHVHVRFGSNLEHSQSPIMMIWTLRWSNITAG